MASRWFGFAISESVSTELFEDYFEAMAVGVFGQRAFGAGLANGVDLSGKTFGAVNMAEQFVKRAEIE